MIRVVTSLILTAFGGAVGYALADKLRSECRICRDIVTLLSRAGFLVGCRGDDIYAICSELRRDSELSRLNFLRELPTSYSAGCDMRKCWREAVCGQNYPEREEDILLRLGGILGRTDSESQQTAIAGLIAETEHLTAQQDELYSKRGRIYRTAGLLFGVMAGILVI